MRGGSSVATYLEDEGKRVGLHGSVDDLQEDPARGVRYVSKSAPRSSRLIRRVCNVSLACGAELGHFEDEVVHEGGCVMVRYTASATRLGVQQRRVKVDPEGDSPVMSTSALMTQANHTYAYRSSEQESGEADQHGSQGAPRRRPEVGRKACREGPGVRPYHRLNRRPEGSVSAYGLVEVALVTHEDAWELIHCREPETVPADPHDNRPSCERNEGNNGG